MLLPDPSVRFSPSLPDESDCRVWMCLLWPSRMSCSLDHFVNTFPNRKTQSGMRQCCMRQEPGLYQSCSLGEQSSSKRSLMSWSRVLSRSVVDIMEWFFFLWWKPPGVLNSGLTCSGWMLIAGTPSPPPPAPSLHVTTNNWYSYCQMSSG